MISMLAINPPMGDGSGSYSMQWLMLSAIVILGGVIAYLFRHTHQQQQKLHQQNQEVVERLFKKLEDREVAMTQERVARIQTLLTQQKEWIQTLSEVKVAILQGNILVDNNNKTLERLESVLTKIVPYLTKS